MVFVKIKLLFVETVLNKVFLMLLRVRFFSEFKKLKFKKSDLIACIWEANYYYFLWFPTPNASLFHKE